MKSSTKVVDDISYLSTDKAVRDKQLRGRRACVNAMCTNVLYMFC